MNKNFAEQAACYILTHLLGYDHTDLFCSDKPDIQSHSGKIGVEVRCDIYQHEQDIIAIAKKIWSKEFAQIPKNARKKIAKYGGEIFADASGSINRIHVGEKTNDPAHLIDSAKDKLNKLNAGGYAIFEENDLYLFVESILLEYAESHIYSFMKAVKDYPGRVFDYIFLDQHYVLYVCNIKTQSFKKVPIPQEFRDELFRNIPRC